MHYRFCNKQEGSSNHNSKINGEVLKRGSECRKGSWASETMQKETFLHGDLTYKDAQVKKLPRGNVDQASVEAVQETGHCRSGEQLA